MIMSGLAFPVRGDVPWTAAQAGGADGPVARYYAANSSGSFMEKSGARFARRRFNDVNDR
jgi:hypothetical protein